MSGTDLRIQKTYAALTGAFIDLLQIKSFEQITVKELCDNAIVRTATFYNHFADKYAFADFVIRDMLHFNAITEMLRISAAFPVMHTTRGFFQMPSRYWRTTRNFCVRWHQTLCCGRSPV